MDIYIYDGFEIVNIINKFTSLRWRRQYYNTGEIELHTSDIPENVDLLTPGMQLVRFDADEVGIIEGVKLTYGELTISGRFLPRWLEDAVIETIYQKTETYETAMRSWVTDYVISEHSDLVLGDVIGGTDSITFQTSYKNVLENIIKFCKACNLGFRIRKNVSSKKYVFELFRGVDRSSEQSINARVFFSNDFANLQNPVYESSEADYKNYAIILGEGEGSARLKTEVDMRKPGEGKRVIYINGSSQSVESGMSRTEYINLLKSFGKTQLEKYQITDNFCGEAIMTPTFVYREDWDLGDIVTIENSRWGKSVAKRIIEVEEIYENGYAQIVPVFGSAKAETLDMEDIL